MGIRELLSQTDFDDTGRQMHDLAVELYPICRSITGDGVRHTLARIARDIPLEQTEVPTGTPAFDWTVPREWNISGAKLIGPDGATVVDFADHNLHVLNYSVPIRRRLPLAELRPHLFSDPAQPDLIPYRTSYYQDNWGFCLPHRQLEQLPDGEYEVQIDSELKPGSLTYGECVLPGRTDGEFLFSSHVCHPSLANDNLSGIVVATRLAHLLGSVERRFTCRFLFVPGTIGAITWLSRNEKSARRVRHGLVLSCLGDSGNVTYKKSRRGDSAIDRVVARVLRESGKRHRVIEFSPYGYDERQYCSPGFDLPVGSLSRTPWGQYPEYHTSGDNLDLIRPEALADSLRVCLGVVAQLETDETFMNLNPACEPQLGKRGLYGAIGGRSDSYDRQMAMLWILNLSDGDHSLTDIAERSGLPSDLIAEVSGVLEQHGLLRRIDE